MERKRGGLDEVYFHGATGNVCPHAPSRRPLARASAKAGMTNHFLSPASAGTVWPDQAIFHLTALLQQPQLKGPRHGLGAVGGVEFVTHGFDVVLHRVLADTEGFGDLGIREAAPQAVERF